MKNVIDVSAWQEIIDWNKVKASGKVDGVMLRAGYGRNNIDKQFHRNARELTRLGIPFGVYWFSYALNVEMARQEARYCIGACAQYRLAYPMCFDLEYDTVRYAKTNGVIIGKTLATKMTNAFCETVKAAGYKPMNYTNLDYLRNMFGTVPYELWFAQYGPSKPSVPVESISMWQYSSSGSVPGVPGRVDMNYCYKDYTGNSEGKPENKPTPKPVTNKIEEDGKWGAATTKRAQQVFGTAVDGVISNQLSGYKAICQGLRSGVEWSETKRGGSSLVKAMQKWLGIAVDGYIGPQFIKSLQKKMGTPVDGKFSNPSQCIKAFQHWLNQQ